MRLVAYHFSGLHSPVPVSDSHIRWAALMVADNVPVCIPDNAPDSMHATRAQADACDEDGSALLDLVDRVSAAQVGYGNCDRERNTSDSVCE